LAKRPEDRYAGVPALVSALRRLGVTPEESPHRRQAPMHPLSSPRRWVSAFNVTILIVLGASALSILVWLALDLSRRLDGRGSGEGLGGVIPGATVGEYVNQRDWSTMVLIPEGPFTMGSDENWARPDESPAHEVHLKQFLIDKQEVSNARYAKFLEELGRTNDHSRCYPGEPRWKDHSPLASAAWTKGDLPVVGVDWYDAYAYAAWANKRLPTEAEWEKAARPDGRFYPWGNQWDSEAAVSLQTWLPEQPDFARDGERLFYKMRAWEGEALTANASEGETGASPFGNVHLSGNVSEWVGDWYDPLYYESSGRVDPQGPETGYARTIRGGSWMDKPAELRSTRRRPWLPSTRSLEVGFRCARDYLQPQ
ncbi:MAG: SUMF1/EgtB/PvdO family nonheme iron enzyme, partial [Planctomycetota bacterium]|nr:SUMF1/EgtB/PvdO family nonheme iron enzyme [Planctomycetota bacterium]